MDFLVQFDRKAFRLHRKYSDFKNAFLAKLLCCKSAVFCFAVLSASLPCATVSEMHVLKKTR